MTGWLTIFLSPYEKGSLKDKAVSLFNTNTPKEIVYGRGTKLSKSKAQNQIINIRNAFVLKNKKKRTKDWIIRYTWPLYETEEEKKEIKKLERIKQRNW